MVKKSNKTNVVQASLFDMLGEDARDTKNKTSVQKNSTVGAEKVENKTSVQETENNQNKTNVQKSKNKASVKKEKTDDDLSSVKLRGMLYELTAGREMDEGDKNATKEYRDYYNGKVLTIALEDNNKSRIIAFPSVGERGKEWYKLGGNSALFYKYYIAPRLKRNPTFRNDSDLRHRFKYGIITVHWGEHLINALRELKYEVKVIDYDIIVCELGREFTEREIDEMRKREKADQEKVKRMITPKYNYPDIYGHLCALARELPPKVKKMDAAYRETIGNDTLRILMKLFRDYFKITNGRMPMEGSAQILLAHVDELAAMLAIIDENKLLDMAMRIRMGTTLVDLKNSIHRRLK